MSLANRRSTFRAAALLALAGAFGLEPIHAHGAEFEFDRFVGRDLWKDRLLQSERSQLRRAIGQVPRGVMGEPEPWHVWKTNRDGAARYIVLLGSREVVVPGSSSACVLLFDGSSKRINEWCFQTGYRITLDSASFEFSVALGSDLIVFRMLRLINGRNVAKEYFAIGNDQLRFVRLENDSGEAVQNEYVFPNFEIGIAPAANTEGEWVGMLGSTDKASILAALVFLGGRHIAEPQRQSAPEPTESRYSELFGQVIGSPRVRELITGLSRSDDEWVRQAALLAARSPRARLLQ